MIKLGTHQETFDKVATHLITQRAASRDYSGCRYRGPDGLKCAVGCLITDEYYHPGIEGLTVDSLDFFEKSDIKLLEDLQCVHDCAHTGILGLFTLENLKLDLQKVAMKHNLSTAVLNP